MSKPTIKAKKSRTKSNRAGLILPVGRIHSYLKSGKYASRVGSGAAIFLSAILEYLAAEILELSANCASQHNKKTIKTRHILLAIKNDEEINDMLSGVVIKQGGVIPSILPELIPKKTAKQNSQEY